MKKARSRLKKNDGLKKAVIILSFMVVNLWIVIFILIARLNNIGDTVVIRKTFVREVQAQQKQYSDVEQLILNEFGEDGEVAIAIAKAESGLDESKEGIHRAGKHSWSSETYKGECSIGLFQINLASDGCLGRHVHASKIPVDTLEAKIEWLKVPENNIKIAKQIYNAQGFYPWSTYTSGKYLEKLNE